MSRILGVAVAACFVLGAGSAPLAAEEYKATIVIKDHLFEPTEIKVPIATRIELTVVNQDPTPEEFESERLRVEKVIPGGASGIVRFGPLAPGSYAFIGEFNQATAQGAVVAE